MTTVLFLLALALQDDLGPWVERLKSDDVRERDAAMQHLQSLGLDALPRLESIRTQDIEVQGRLREAAATIRKRVELAKVFGPTRRVSLSFKQRRLGEVLSELERSLDEKFDRTSVDPEKVIDLELKDATSWQVLDALGRAAGLRYTCGRTITLQPGDPAALPCLCVEQFRISVAEVKRVRYQEPGQDSAMGLVTVIARYQRNLKPIGQSFDQSIRIESVVDQAGVSQMIERPHWASSWSMEHHPQTYVQTIGVNPDAGPLTLQGTTQFLFGVRRKEMVLPLEEGKRDLVDGESSIRVSGFSQTAAKTAITLRVKSSTDLTVEDRLKKETVVLVDAKGERHPGTYRGGGGSPGEMSSDFEFPAGIVKPDRVVLEWITEFHRVEIPFRFEGVRFP